MEPHLVGSPRPCFSPAGKRDGKREGARPRRGASSVRADLPPALSQLSLSALSGSSSGLLLLRLPPALLLRGLGHALEARLQLSGIGARCRGRRNGEDEGA